MRQLRESVVRETLTHSHTLCIGNQCVHQREKGFGIANDGNGITDHLCRTALLHSTTAQTNEFTYYGPTVTITTRMMVYSAHNVHTNCHATIIYPEQSQLTWHLITLAASPSQSPCWPTTRNWLILRPTNTGSNDCSEWPLNYHYYYTTYSSLAILLAMKHKNQWRITAESWKHKWAPELCCEPWVVVAKGRTEWVANERQKWSYNNQYICWSKWNAKTGGEVQWIQVFLFPIPALKPRLCWSTDGYNKESI